MSIIKKEVRLSLSVLLFTYTKITIMIKTKHVAGSSDNFDDTVNFFLRYLQEAGCEIIGIKYSSVYQRYNDSPNYSALIIYKIKTNDNQKTV